jgi:hypothetical protein
VVGVMPFLAFLAGALVVAGIVLGILQFTPAPPPKPAASRRPRRSLRRSIGPVSRRTQGMLIVGVAAGIAAALISGVVALVVVVPIAVIGLPRLLGKPDTRDRDMLSALEAWSRSLAAASATGRLTLREVIGVTRTSTPDILRNGVDQMYLRMTSTWTNSAALRAFAEDMQSAWVDEVAIYLIQAADYSSAGLSDALNAIADNLASQVKLRQEVYKEREKPRRVMVQITMIAGGTLLLLVLLARTDALSAYATPLGQFLMLVVLAAMAGLLLLARSIGRARPEPRFLLGEEAR